MFTKIDKAWVSALVGFAAMTAANFFGFEIDETLQAAVIAVIWGVVTYLVPNKEEAPAA